ncbi:MAG: CooT family nickel-binding protein [Candidatus Baldrarchaeia archaeon]
MCEFSVVVREGSSEKEVARDIIYARMCDRGLTLRSFLDEKTANSAVIFEVDVTKERMVLIRAPFIEHFLKLLLMYESYRRGERDADAVKKMLDEFYREVKKYLDST